jgi:V/A-type H+/Na+-transporting ATPase subunit I
MRVDVNKILFIGSRKDKTPFFDAMQKAGIIEFINPQGLKELPLSQEAQNLTQAIKILREYIQEEQDLKKEITLAPRLTEQILALKHTKDTTDEQKRVIQQEIDRIHPFGNFSIETINKLEQESGYKVRFYLAKTSKHIDQACPQLILINTEEGIDYFLSITDKRVTCQDAIEVQIHESASELKSKLENLDSIIENCDIDLRKLTKYNHLLHQALIEDINTTNLQRAKGSAALHLDSQLFAAEGWVPKNKIMLLHELARRYDVHIEEVAAEKYQERPTYLENKGTARVGEDLIHIFDTPSNADKDPSLWVLFAFSLFFAMIVGDAGYGIIFLLTAAFLRFKMKKISHLTRRFLILVGILGFVCLFWGGLTHSFFGITLSRNNPIRTHSLMTWLIEKKADYHLAQKDDVYDHWVHKYPEIKDSSTADDFLYPKSLSNQEKSPIVDKFADNIMMEFALLFGSIHIILGLFRYLGKNPIGAGWIAFIIGAYLYVINYIHGTSILNFAFGIDKVKGADFGLQLLCAGLVYSVIGGLIRFGLTGIFEIMTAIQILADILSYLRIYALGLAGAIVSGLINEVAGSVPLFLAIVIIIACHFFNIILSIMGGTIHGLRLNFLEWYHYSFEGGGRLFKPLKMHTLE